MADTVSPQAPSTGEPQAPPAAHPEPVTAKQAPRRRGPNKAKSAAHTKMTVKTVYGHPIYAHTQKILIRPSTIVEVLDDSWVRRQIKLGTLTEV